MSHNVPEQIENNMYIIFKFFISLIVGSWIGMYCKIVGSLTPYHGVTILLHGHMQHFLRKAMRRVVACCMLYIGPPVLSQPAQKVAFVIADDHPSGNGKKITAIIHFSNMKFSKQKKEMILLVFIRFHFFFFRWCNKFFFLFAYLPFFFFNSTLIVS